ncbi:hypothetical protein [Ammoniphilus sp. 3BR4]|uniref:hypothetical protein n=1 Tax=Ammoniphilus sp. 3BR4 TaxID=3158265 RepID=UPI0034667F66
MGNRHQKPKRLREPHGSRSNNISFEACKRQQKIQSWSSLPKEAVNPQGTEEVPSSSPARFEETTREDHYNYLMDLVLERGNMLQALRRVEKNKGAAGVDGMEIQSLRPYLFTHWEDIRNQLLNGTYKPQPVRRVEIPKPDGGVRGRGLVTPSYLIN